MKKQNTCKITFDLSITVKVTIILFFCGLLNCIRADLFMNNALYKCCIITHHSLRCIAQRSNQTNGHSDDMETSRKEQLSLLDFMVVNAACLCVKSEPEVKRKGRLSIET